MLFDVGYEYDRANRLVRTSDRTTHDTLIEHVIKDGELVETRYGNGLVRAYTYDPAGLLVATETRNVAAATSKARRSSRSGETNPVRLEVQCRGDSRRSRRPRSTTGSMRERAIGPGQARVRLEPRLRCSALYAYDELSNQIVPGGGASRTTQSTTAC